MTASDVEDGHSPSASPEDSGAEQGVDGMVEQLAADEKAKQQNGTPSTNSKDPSRPRRKKARRACYACQRAHLTCGKWDGGDPVWSLEVDVDIGDERPCQRCIKRGLQDACQDGVRKKAKYLHDAPNEALMPGIAGKLYNHAAVKRSNSTNNTDGSQSQFFGPTPPYSVYQPSSQMPPPMMNERSVSTTSFPTQSPMTATFNGANPVPMQSPGVVAPDQSNHANINASGWTGALFDDPSLFNFDIASMNFGNHYGALEFGMLGKMANNVGDTPPSDTTTQRGSIAQPYQVPLGSFSESPTANFTYNDPMVSDWSAGADAYNAQVQGRANGVNAFAIESSAAHFTSPDTNGTPTNTMKFEDSPMMTNNAPKHQSSGADNGQGQAQTLQPPTASDNPGRPPAPISTPQLKARSQLPVKSRRPRDPSSIYTSVTSPHPYTANFHSLVAYLQRRFANQPARTLAIAKSLASIRPSFIATTKTLNRDDLIFMEKCFQRTLWEYEGFIEGVGTPTIVARRTGEVAAVGKEFQILTGWTKSVLLGRAPNLNVNRGHSGATPTTGSGANTAGRTTGFNTPTQKPSSVDLETGEKRLQPVFLAELLDDETVVQFYEDFARLAFGDSRGSIMGKGKLLKYRTKDDEIAQNLNAEVEAQTNDDPNGNKSESRPNNTKRIESLKKDGISGEKGMQKLGSADGKVDCTYCWTVKRDVFDIPMLIVMNVSFHYCIILPHSTWC